MLNARIIISLLLISGLLRAAEPPPQAEPMDLNQVLQIALEHDGRIRAAYARLDSYRAIYEEAFWSWFPKIKIRGIIGGPVGERRLACPGDPACVELANTSNTELGDLSEELSFVVSGKVEAVLPIYTFGKYSEAKRGARAGIRAGEAGIEQISQEVALQVRRAWYAWQLSSTTVEILLDGEKKLKQAEKKLIKMLDELNESVTDRDLFKLRYNSAELKRLILEARQAQSLSLASLRFLTGLPKLGQERPLAQADLSRPREIKTSRGDFVAQAIRQRHDLRQLQAAREAAAAEVGYRRAQFYPDIFIAGRFEGSYSPAHEKIDNSLLNKGLTYYSGGATLGFQLTLDVPQKWARLEKAEAVLNRLDIQLEQARQAMGLEVDQRLAKLAAAEEYWKVLRKGTRAAKAWRRSNFMSYGIGMANTKDLIDALTAYAKSQIARAQAAHDWQVTRDRLSLTIGQDLGVAGD